MNNNRKYPFLLLWVVLFSGVYCSCEENTALKETYIRAGENRKELNRVLQHYQADPDTQKLKAALFLLENMKDHYSPKSEAIDEFVNRLHNSDTIVKVPTMNEWWQELQKCDKPIPDYDARVLSADFLIHEIDLAFKIWRESRWHAIVNFNSFCQYLLPYRFEHELLIEGWRDTLYNQYYPVIAEAQTMQEAFTLIFQAVQKQMTRGSMAFPYVPNVLDMRKQFKGSCMQYSIYLASVLKAVGIPVAIDQISQWANYSKNGHAWVSMVTPQGTYTILEGDSLPRINKIISSSFFPITHILEEDYPYPTNFTKQAFKIYRQTYQHQLTGVTELDEFSEAFPLILRGHFIDVSAEYGKSSTIGIKTDRISEYAWLCTFPTGRNWSPVGYGRWINGEFCFENMGDSIVYLPIIIKNNKITPLDNPFLSMVGRKISFCPNVEKKQCLILSRKYPLIGTFMERWSGMRGGVFEGSNDLDFHQKELLYTIDRTPVFRNVISLKGQKTYRYIRYVSLEDYDYPIAEIEIWSANRKLTGTPFIVNGIKANKCFDGDLFSLPEKVGIGYKVGIDLGKSIICDSIVYYPKNDGNFVIPGHEYELFYYDKQWISLGKKIAADWQLVYDEVPTNALFILKDRTKGDEERIFTYENGKQVWW